MAGHMKAAKKLEALGRIADAVLDQRLHVLKCAQLARNATKEKILALEQPHDRDTCSLQASARAALLYQAWADIRRKELNLVLARQTVIAMETEADARLAFSRHSALRQLQARQQK